MKRHFIVDAKSKIQAAPVDFDKLSGLKIPKASEVEALLNEHESELIEYADAKFNEVTSQINADLKEIFANYIETDDESLDRFWSILAQGNWDNREDSTILQDLQYVMSSLDDVINSDVWANDIEFETPDVAFAMWLDDDAPISDINLTACDGLGFVRFGLYYIFAAKDYRKQITLDTVIPICQQIIYEYADFVDRQFSKILERAVTKYLEGV